MKKVMLLAIAMLFAANIFAKPLTGASDTTKTKKVKTAKVVYTCPMHPDVISDKPGKCPKPGCGMTLVKKTEKKTEKM